MVKLLSVKPSTNKNKKFDALFDINGKKKSVSFGQSGADDFTKTKNVEQKKIYLARHEKREKWSDPLTAGSLSRYVLWNKPTMKASIEDFKQRFGI